jgi:hypothetical protein
LYFGLLIPTNEKQTQFFNPLLRKVEQNNLSTFKKKWSKTTYPLLKKSGAKQPINF